MSSPVSCRKLSEEYPRATISGTSYNEVIGTTTPAESVLFQPNLHVGVDRVHSALR